MIKATCHLAILLCFTVLWCVNCKLFIEQPNTDQFAGMVNGKDNSPAAPENTASQAESANSIKISWEPVARATEYRIYRSKDGIAYEMIKVEDAAKTSYTDTDGLEPATPYFYKVSAYNAAGEQLSSAYTALTFPGSPTGIDQTEATKSSVTITWSTVTGATGYRIYRDDTNNQIADVTSTVLQYTDHDLKSATAYTYYVSAYNASGETISIQYVTLTCPAAPKNIAKTRVTMNSVMITWEQVPGAAGYKISHSIDGITFEEIQTIEDAAKTSCIDTGLQPATLYYYKVIAYNTSGTSEEPTPVAVLTSPNIPSNVSVAVVSASGIDVAWIAVPRAIKYNIYRSESLNASYVKVNTVMNTTYQDTGLLASTLYYYKITAIADGDVEGDFSDIVSATTLLTTPQKPVVEQRLTISVALSWEVVPGAASYKVYYGTADSFVAALLYQTITDNKCTITGLTGGAIYYFWVTAHRGENYSNPSPSTTTETINTNITVDFRNPSDPVLVREDGSLPEKIIIRQIQRDSYTIKVETGDWILSKWLLDGREFPAAADDSCIIDWQIPVGPHVLTVIVTKNGIPYSAFINFAVVNR